MQVYSPQPKHAPSIVVACLLAACGGAPSESSIAKALEHESEERQVAEALDAKREAELKKKAEEDQQKSSALQAEIETLTSQPATMPKNVNDGCERLVNAYDQYMRNIKDEREALAWFDGRRKKTAQRRANCLRQNSVPAGACQAHALEGALQSAAILELGQKGATRLMVRCAEKHGVSLELAAQVDEEPAGPDDRTPSPQ